MKKLLSLFVISTFFSIPVSAEENIDKKLEGFYSEYKQIKSKPNVENLVKLNNELYSFIQSHNISQKYFKKEYSELGLYLRLHDKNIDYNYKFLSEAHKLNPNSNLRKYTLFSTVLSDTSMPNINSTMKYLKEFPNAPYSEDANLIIADFNKDLFMVLRNKENSKNTDYKYDCFKNYINKTTNSKEQIKKVQKEGIVYYQKVLKINPKNRTATENLNGLKSGNIETWTYCQD